MRLQVFGGDRGDLEPSDGKNIAMWIAVCSLRPLDMVLARKGAVGQPRLSCPGEPQPALTSGCWRNRPETAGGAVIHSMPSPGPGGWQQGQSGWVRAGLE